MSVSKHERQPTFKVPGRDAKRSLVVPLRRIATGPLQWSATVPAAVLLEAEPTSRLGIADVEVPLDTSVRVALALEFISGDLLVTGEIEAGWRGPCARCWLPLDGHVKAAVHETFTALPREGEQYELGPEYADLTPMVREAILLELPIKSIRCPHPEPCPHVPAELGQTHSDPAQNDPAHNDRANDDEAQDRTDATSDTRIDPRWAALDVLRNQVGPTDGQP